MPKVRVGIVGCGDVAQGVYLPNLTRMAREGQFDFVAACDIIPERAALAHDMYGVPQTYTDLDEMLADANLDILVNLTPTQEHTACILKGIAAGKHVYTEKAISVTIAEADRIIAEGRKAGVMVGSAPAVMTHPQLQEFKKMMQDGLIGKICFVRARGSHPGPDRLLDFRTDPSWFHRPGAGPIIDLGIYPIHALTGMLGPVKRVTAFGGIALPDRVVAAGVAKGKKIDVEVDDNVHLLLDFGDACFAYVDATYCVLSAKGPRMEIYGTTGVIAAYSRPDEPPYEVFRRDMATDFRGWVQPEKVYRGSLMPAPAAPPPFEWSLASGVAHMARCLSGVEEFMLTAEHARHTLEIILGAQQSIKTGQAVKIETSF